MCVVQMCILAICVCVCAASMHVRHSTAAQALKENQRLKEEVAEEHQRKQVAVDYLLGVTAN